ncbi:NAD-dependent epimerase/dehydratase family protein [Chloroflexota bacterium]
MKLLITGGAGTVGSSLSELLVAKNHDVTVLDIVRLEEAWKLEPIKDKISYVWKSQYDISEEDINNFDLIIDCAIAFADRPLGISSPVHSLIGNLLSPLSLLESVRKCNRKPILIYPSSYNALYGHGAGTIFKEDLLPLPSSMYGWTKCAVEQLYWSYAKSYEIPVIITRVSSAYGPKMRSDELLAKLIIYCLLENDFYLKSPQSKRLWTYSSDIISFYERLIEAPETFIGKVLHCAGNIGDQIVTNVELADIIQRLIGSTIKIHMGEYEPGELLLDKPINFSSDSTYSKSILNWEPQYSLESGLNDTIKWFRENLNTYYTHTEFQ